MSDDFKKEIWTFWLRAHYFQIVEQVLRDSDVSSSCAHDVNASTSMFKSPRKKQRTKPSHTDGPLHYFTVHDLHTSELDEAHAFGLEACVLYCPSEPRTTLVSNRFTGRSDTVSVLSVLLADRSGPILFEAWRAVSEKFTRSHTEWSESNDAENALFVSLTRFDVKEDARVHQTPIRKLLHATEHTRLSRLLTPSRASLPDASIIAHTVIYTKDFNRLSAPVPFQINICGIISAAGGETTAASGEPTKSFRLQDTSGKYVACRAYGRHASNECIENGKMVILYFAQAQDGLRNQPGMLWLYNESHIVELRSDSSIPVARVQTLLKGA